MKALVCKLSVEESQRELGRGQVGPDLIRYVGLMLTTALGREVRQVLPPAERTALARRRALVDSLVGAGVLYAELQIPDVAGALSVSADLRSRQIMVSTSIAAPREGTSKGCVSWLLRQLQSAPDALTMEARVAGRSASLAAPLSAVRTNPSLIHPDKGREIRTFVLSTTSNMGLRLDSGRESFADGILGKAENFYEQVLQKLHRTDQHGRNEPLGDRIGPRRFVFPKVSPPADCGSYLGEWIGPGVR